MSKLVAAGYSLISLLVSMSIVGVLIGLTLSSVSFLDQLLVRTELSALYATCCYAQQVAQMRGEPCEILCDAKLGSYTCAERIRTLPKTIKFGVMQGMRGPPSHPHKSVTNPITFKHSCIRSTPHGMLSSGTLYLVDTGNRYQYALSSGIAQVSCLRCYRYDKGWHMLRY